MRFRCVLCGLVVLAAVASAFTQAKADILVYDNGPILGSYDVGAWGISAGARPRIRFRLLCPVPPT